MDQLDIVDHFEDPDEYERVMKRIYADARSDADLQACLVSAYLDEDRPGAFRRYLASGAPAALSHLLGRLGIDKSKRICDYGCGPGQLGWALRELGHDQVSWMDPNDHYFTGTGFLRESIGPQADIVSDPETWAARAHSYDAIVSKGTIHHWDHIPSVSIGLRRALKPGGLWFAVSEFFAHSPAGLVASLRNHPFYHRYKTYEWPYPASAYVDLIESTGFQLHLVIPLYYKENAFVDFNRPAPESIDVAALEVHVNRSLSGENETVERFWSEVDYFRRSHSGVRIYTHPQVMVFRRIGVD